MPHGIADRVQVQTAGGWQAQPVINPQQPFPDIRTAHGQHADGYTFSVVKGIRRSHAFNAMADGMSEIEDFPQPLFLLILLHDILFDFQGTQDDFFYVFVYTAFRKVFFGCFLTALFFVFTARGFDDLFKKTEEIFVKGHRHLQCFRQTRRQMTGRQAVQDICVDQDPAGLIEGTHRVLDAVQIDGRLAADGGIHLGEKGGRNIVEINAPHIAGGRKACQIPADAAAHSHDTVVSVKALRQHGAEQTLEILQILVALSLTDGADHRLFTGRGKTGRVSLRHPAVCHDQDLSLQWQQCSCLFQAASFDHNVIAFCTRTNL